MTCHRRTASLTLAAIPYLLLSSSHEAGIITHVGPDGSGERMVYARAAPSRTPEVHRQLRATLPWGAWRHTENEGGTYLAWRDTHVANLARVGEIETSSLGIVQAPLSIYTKHVWKETLEFDRGDATEVEVHGQGLATLKYMVRMPGKITSQSPTGKTEGNKVTWEITVGPEPQAFTVESRTVRWPYLALWVYVLVFVISKLAIYAPRAAKRIRRKPRKI